MRIALLGYGKMGKSIERIGLSKGYVFPLNIDAYNQDQLTPETLKKCDVAIEFSTPETAVQNLRFCLENQVPVVCGTTGWHQHKKEIDALCISNNGTLLVSSNFSLGVNLFFDFTAYVARRMKALQDVYSLSIAEVHHTEKKDCPSGTAIHIAEEIIANSHYEQWHLKQDHQPSIPSSIPIESFREKDVIGIHDVLYQSEVDSIRFSHTAHTRDGFALGALMAAAYIKDKKGIFNMRDVLNLTS